MTFSEPSSGGRRQGACRGATIGTFEWGRGRFEPVLRCSSRVKVDQLIGSDSVRELYYRNFKLGVLGKNL